MNDKEKLDRMHGDLMAGLSQFVATPEEGYVEAPYLVRRDIEKIGKELADFKSWGIIEVAIRNPNVAEYMKHWEGRTEKAETALKTSEEAREKAEGEHAEDLKAMEASRDNYRSDRNQAVEETKQSEARLTEEIEKLKKHLCPQCGGQGWYTGSEHDPSCDGTCANCPVPVQVQCDCSSVQVILREKAEQALAETKKELRHTRNTVCAQSSEATLLRQTLSNTEQALSMEERELAGNRQALRDEQDRHSKSQEALAEKEKQEENLMDGLCRLAGIKPDGDFSCRENIARSIKTIRSHDAVWARFKNASVEDLPFVIVGLEEALKTSEEAREKAEVKGRKQIFRWLQTLPKPNGNDWEWFKGELENKIAQDQVAVGKPKEDEPICSCIHGAVFPDCDVHGDRPSRS